MYINIEVEDKYALSMLDYLHKIEVDEQVDSKVIITIFIITIIMLFIIANYILDLNIIKDVN